MKKISKSSTIKIIICNSCKGDGISDMRKKGYIDYNVCESCNGTGRQVEKTTIEWMPFTSNKLNVTHMDLD